MGQLTIPRQLIMKWGIGIAISCTGDNTLTQVLQRTCIQIIEVSKEL